ncbi:MAG: LysR family transcriptional regulator [Neisseria sp.]|uniref:LysR family transcriptional regulator n=1 Tax=Neisseria sp. TaxID=192066 RepID=UPI0026DB9558|nr:LysR family transcriptional regulator [Neisseria sp.]MDO4247829.1 LysR family transcriptional regulator [Neisseria sp.]
MRDLRSLDLNLLKAFDALMDERSVSRAAERLSVTQPAMSGILTRLRDSFDDPLFVRVQRGVEPTNRALGLAGPVKQLLHDAAQLLQPPRFEPQLAETVLKIACTDYALYAVVTPFLTALRRQAPHIRTAVLALDETRLQTQLEQGQVDFALVTPDFQAPDLHALNLYREEYVCALRSGHPLAAQEELTLEQFCQTEQALVSYHGGSFSGVTDQALAQAGLARRVAVSVQNFLILPELLRCSDLLAVAPQKLVAGLSGIKTFAPPLAITGFTKTLVWHERSHRDPAYRWLRQLMAHCCETGAVEST